MKNERLNVPSPTFTLVQSYEAKERLVHHYDLYRLPESEAEADILELGWEESLEDAIVLIEWPERLGDLMPEQRIEVKLEMADHPDKRTIKVDLSHLNEERSAPIRQRFNKMKSVDHD